MSIPNNWEIPDLVLALKERISRRLRDIDSEKLELLELLVALEKTEANQKRRGTVNSEIPNKNIEPEKILTIEIQATTAKENLEAVIGILRSKKFPMRRKEIAEYAHANKLIISKNALPGVEAIVGNILSRNERFFVNTGWGWWNLSEHHKAEQIEPLRFPREKEAEAGPPKTIH